MKARRRSLCLGAAFAVCLGGSWAALADDSVDLTVPEVRALARDALQSGRPDLARELAMGLLKADQEDAYAYAVLANAHSQLGNPGLARSAARLTYKHSDSGDNRYTAARAAGQLAFDQNRMTTAQIWLRRAALHSDTAAKDKILQRDYAAIRSQNPLRFSIRGDLTPSSNLNNGAESDEVYVNGVLQNVTLGTSSQALSGWAASLDGRVTYRLRHTENSRTTVGGRLYTRHVRLSDDAKARAPTVSNSDFGVTYMDLSVDHAFKLGAAGNSAAVQGAFGAVWVAGDHSYSFARFGGRRSLKTGEQGRLSFSLSNEWRLSELGSDRDSQLLRIGTHYAHRLERGDTVSLSFSAGDIRSDFDNSSYQNMSLRLGYAFGKQVGPATVEAGLSIGRVDYDAYIFATGAVPGGRQDVSLNADLNLVFRDYDYAGFAPSVHIKAGRTDSNISRFTTSEVSVGFGIQSKF